MRRIVLLAIFLSSISLVAIDSQAASADVDLEYLASRIVELTNQERANAGLLPVKWNESLAEAARSHAKDMARRDYFSHTSPEGTMAPDRARAAGYAAYGEIYMYVGENLAKAYSDPNTLVQAWMGSPGHRQNTLWPQYREIGVGVAAKPNGTLYWAQVFGSRPMELPVFINGDAAETVSPSVTLAITAEDVSNWGSMDSIAAVMLSSSPDFSGATWEPFSPLKSWTLSDRPGVQRVYVRLMDIMGNIVQASDEIVLSDGVDPRTASVEVVSAPQGSSRGHPADAGRYRE